ncbi:MAG TPA: hypothetical protein VGA13_13005 [Acidimicrobiales bacterium]
MPTPRRDRLDQVRRRGDFLRRRRRALQAGAPAAVVLLVGLSALVIGVDDDREGPLDTVAAPAGAGEAPDVQPGIGRSADAFEASAPTTVTTVADGVAPDPSGSAGGAPAAGPTGGSGSSDTRCRNSYDSACGPFRYDPDPPADQPLTVAVDAPGSVIAGSEVTFDVVADDPDAPISDCRSWDFGDGTTNTNDTVNDPPTCGDESEPPQPARYGQWDPPEPGPAGRRTDTYTHTFDEPGTYTVMFRYRSDGFYGSEGAGEIQITVLGI